MVLSLSRLFLLVKKRPCPSISGKVPTVHLLNELPFCGYFIFLQIEISPKLIGLSGETYILLLDIAYIASLSLVPLFCHP
jgi:hypothetical protein